MAIDLSSIENYLMKHDLRFMSFEERNFVALGFPTTHYLDKDGDNHVTVIISLEEEGEYIKFFVPRCYVYRGPYKETLFQYLLMICFKTQMIQFEYDPEDGEIRAIIEFPIEDGTLTERQCMRSILSLVEVIDDVDTAIRSIMDGGVIPENISSGKPKQLKDSSSNEQEKQKKVAEDCSTEDSEDSDDFDEI